ncbi:NAD(P)/FAD-dependent oxidoreductase [Fusobacterium perfoetens]|uniref:NAD(P)/FAD-dependent oxidoreductase n=1 Tax=Fusobacterium perfoetens TaxID=852 RepID=UPI0004880CDA|nr:FAD-dependent monooxygenase [Fusobacterium perfoetens]
MKICINNIMIPVIKNQDKEIEKEIIKKGIKKENIDKILWLKRSIDSRKKNDIKFVYNLEVHLKKDIDIKNMKNVTLVKEDVYIKREPINKEEKVLVVGTGPAGLFSALRLVEYGYKPIVIDRGEDIDSRDKSVENFINTGVLNENSNIQFGEGGAGTYSDGKLNTRIRSEYIDKVFKTFVECGAQEEIMWDYKPHIGTDVLKGIIKNLREKIISMGGKFYFNNKLEEIIIENNKVVGAIINNNKNEIEKLDVDKIVLGVGHSARDTYRMLHKKGVKMESKPFAVGARIEHPREDIDKMQYGKFANHKNLGAATYNFTYNNYEEERGVFSFCMCPGGVIVNAASQKGGSLVNGMSYSDRNGEFSNSALVVGIKENEFGDDLFSGMEFQEELEKKSYEIVKDYGAIYQSVTDFLDGKITDRDIKTSYLMKKTPYDLNKFFPDVITRNMKMALRYWGKNNPLFVSERANLIAPETRTSAPIRILRDENGESINIKGLYPIGEGAGYAGGIVSAGVDGLKIIDKSFSKVVE